MHGKRDKPCFIQHVRPTSLLLISNFTFLRPGNNTCHSNSNVQMQNLHPGRCLAMKACISKQFRDRERFFASILCPLGRFKNVFAL